MTFDGLSVLPRDVDLLGHPSFRAVLYVGKRCSDQSGGYPFMSGIDEGLNFLKPFVR